MTNGFQNRLRENISRVIVGKDEVIELLVCAVLARGHVLFEDVPGTGKTLIARTLAKSISADFQRIQFTPDLLPTDVTGAMVYNAKRGEFEFKPGAVFTNILLADEINRATPRTQSSLLECMEERQVTIDGETRPLKPPFLVIATQNPVETQGTFPLPEAQLDRFLMKIRPGYPDFKGEMDIIERFILESPLDALASCATAEEVVAAQAEVPKIHVSLPIREYIVSIVDKTRAIERAQLGVSPRGMLSLIRAAQALAMIRGRDYVIPDDVKTLALPVLSHRIIARGLYGQSVPSDDIVQEALASVPAPTEEIRR